MVVTFPALEIITNHSSANAIYHCIQTQREFIGEIRSTNRSFLVIGNDSERCCFTGNENIGDQDSTYIALCSKALKEENIKRDKLHFRRWLKHPQLHNYNPALVLASWKNSFHFIEEDILAGRNGLRVPQIGAIHTILGHLKLAEDIATVVLPTGTGKTETMLSVLIAAKCAKLLVVVPSDPLRSQIAEKFKTLGYLKKFGIVNNDAINPIVGVLTTKFSNVEALNDFFSKCNVIVSTMNLLAGSTPEQIKRVTELTSHVFVDEAHHSKAGTWNSFIKSFEGHKVFQFTATPYRNDGERLDGKIIFNFSLRKAQEQGYFKPITFIPVREYDSDKSDKLIADTAVSKLRADRAAGLNHVLMARCEDKDRARNVFKLYEKHIDLKPVVIYSGLSRKQTIVEEIRRLEHYIIVCVDMLGEGFDLPQLKIAAFHDIRKSLPVTLQFAGRFTRTSVDDNLGNASFVANIYQPGVSEELSELYAKDANWNLLLPGFSSRNTQEQIDFQEFLSGFRNMKESLIPFQNIRPALSTVAYKNLSNQWNPTNFANGITGFDSYTHKFHDYNIDAKTLVVLLGREVSVEWGNFEEIANIEWSLIVVFWESHNNILFIHGSDTGSHFQDLAKAVLGEENARLINGMDVFKVFHEIHRVSLYNVGLRKVIGRDLSFQSYIGRSVGEALNYLTRGQGIKNNVFGVGFENGDKVTLGCSQKGRIWSYARGNLRDLTIWCKQIGAKLINQSINPDTVLEGTLYPESITSRPEVFPVAVDWDPDVYGASEDFFEFRTIQGTYNVSTSELCLNNPSLDGPLQFSFHTDQFDVLFQLELSERRDGADTIAEFRIRKVSEILVTVVYGSKSFEIEAFFNKFVPIFWFADGSLLNGNYYVKLREQMPPFPVERIISHDWTGVNLRSESQHVNPLVTDSIQYHFIQKLVAEDFEVVYDDDYAGEIADVIAIKISAEVIDIHLYHLKWASDGRTSNDIRNLYEVCGQAQKSVNWKYKDSSEFYHHLLRRLTKTRNNHNRSRLEKGTEEDLALLLRVSNSLKPTKFHINIVQPSLSKTTVSHDILLLLGVTSTYLRDTAGIELGVIASA